MVVEEEGSQLLHGCHAFRERLAVACFSKALRSRPWPARGGIPGCIQPEEGSSTGRAGGVLGARRGVGGQLLPAPGSRCAKQNQEVSCDPVSLVGEPSPVGIPAQATPAFLLLQLLSPQRQEGYSPQARTNIAVPRVRKLLRSWGSTKGPAFLSLPALQSQVCIQQPFYISHGIRNFSLVAVLFLLSNRNHSSSTGNLSPQPTCWHQHATSRQRLRSSVLWSLIEFIRILQDKSLLIEF